MHKHAKGCNGTSTILDDIENTSEEDDSDMSDMSESIGMDVMLRNDIPRNCIGEDS